MKLLKSWRVLLLITAVILVLGACSDEPKDETQVENPGDKDVKEGGTEDDKPEPNDKPDEPTDDEPVVEITTETESPLLAKGEAWGHKFTTEGTYLVSSSAQSNMAMTVIVREGGADSKEVTIDGFGFSPTEVVVAPGGSVTFTVEGNMSHRLLVEIAGK